VSNITRESERTEILADIKKELEACMSGEELQERHSEINYVHEIIWGRDLSGGPFSTVKASSIVKTFPMQKIRAVMGRIDDIGEW